MKRALALALALAAACSAPATGPPAPTPTPSAAPTPVPSTTPRPEPSVELMLADVRALAGFGPREAASQAYHRSAGFVAGRFRALGYRVRRQRVAVPAGRIDDIEVPAGRTVNVIAEPRGFDPARPYVVVGGHLDTAANSPGANDNASGVAVMLDLARMAALRPPRAQMVFVAFGAEERRRGPNVNVFAAGSFAYVRSVRDTALAGAIVLDMVGAGREVQLLGRGRFVVEAHSAARRLRIPASVVTTTYYSDHIPFEQANVPAVWFYGGDHPSRHTPADLPPVVERAQLVRIARVAWETMRALRV